MSVRERAAGQLLNILSTRRIATWLGILDLRFLPAHGLPQTARNVRAELVQPDSTFGGRRAIDRLADELALSSRDREYLKHYLRTQFDRAGPNGVGISAVFCASNLLWALAWTESDTGLFLRVPGSLRQDMRALIPRDRWRRQIEQFEDSLGRPDQLLLDAGSLPFDYLVHRRGVERSWARYCELVPAEVRGQIEADAEQHASQIGLTLQHHGGRFPKLEENLNMLVTPPR